MRISQGLIALRDREPSYVGSGSKNEPAYAGARYARRPERGDKAVS